MDFFEKKCCFYPKGDTKISPNQFPILEVM